MFFILRNFSYFLQCLAGCLNQEVLPLPLQLPMPLLPYKNGSLKDFKLSVTGSLTAHPEKCIYLFVKNAQAQT